jgi:Flp pilus assembly pilin Flp
MTLLKRIWLLLQDESGQGAVDYALLGMLVALAAVTAVHSVAGNIGHAFVAADRVVTAAMGACLPHHGPHP